MTKKIDAVVGSIIVSSSICISFLNTYFKKPDMKYIGKYPYVK